MANQIFYADNLPVLQALPDESVQLIYCKPPAALWRGRAPGNDDSRPDLLFGGSPYRSRFDGAITYLTPRVEAMQRVLRTDGSLYFHLPPEAALACKVFLLDAIFGRAGFMSEVIWIMAPEPADNTRRWPASYETLLVYAKDLKSVHFDLQQVERIPYMAPGLVGPKKRQRGKLPTDTWWQSQLTSSPVEMAVRASSAPGGLVLDPFARQGEVGEVCLQHGREFILIDHQRAALEAMAQTFAGQTVQWHNFP